MQLLGGLGIRAGRARWGRSVGLATLVMVLAACGGGNSDPCGLSLSCSGSGTDTGGTTGGSTGGTTTPTASDLTLTLSAPTLLNNGTDKVTATVSAVDGNRILIADVPVTVSVDANATAEVSGKVTDAKGVVTAIVGVGADRTNRVVTVTAVAGSLKRTVTFQILGARIISTALPATLAPGAAGTVRFRLTDVNAAPIPQQTIVVRGVGGTELSGTTDTNGDFSYNYTAPATAGPLSIAATVGLVTSTQVVQVQAVAAIPTASPEVEAKSVALSSNVVPVNGGITANQIEVSTLFLGDTNRPVENVRVRFDLDGDVNGVGGSFTTSDTIVYSDAVGTARTSFIPGVRSSPTDGVTIGVCWDKNDFALGTCPNRLETTLTVVSEPLSVSIGTNNLLEIGPTQIDYVKRFLVQVNNAAGAPVTGTKLSATLDLKRYFTGFYEPVGIEWIQRVQLSCDNEDLNRNGSVELYSNGANEDANKNGQLDPRRSDVVVSFEGTGETDSRGQAVLRITYPKSVASWIEYRLDVQASGIGGSEGRAGFQRVLSVLDSEVRGVDRLPPPPAFVESPYNVTGLLPATNVVNPDGRSGLLCSRP